MCGIIGYVGKENAAEILLKGLALLEYRGYDSAGMALLHGGDMRVVKSVGKVEALRPAAQGLSGSTGIGHTRWATHGRPTEANCHPHVSGRIAVVHNGIIENYRELKERLIALGYSFESQTDTEAVAHLIASLYSGDLTAAVRDACAALKGSYALAVISCDHPDTVVAARKDSPLVIGLSREGNYLCSDIPTLAEFTHTAYVLRDGEAACLTSQGVRFYNSEGKSFSPPVQTLAPVRLAAADLTDSCAMRSEIAQIPQALEQTRKNVQSGFPEALLRRLESCRSVIMVGCGTAYHAAVIGCMVLERCARILSVARIAGEFRYQEPVLEEDSVVIAVTQSGETADTLAAIRLAKESGTYVLAITNVRDSSVTRLADATFFTDAGKETAVCATKSYNCQLAALYALALECAARRGRALPAWEKALNDLPGYARAALDRLSEAETAQGQLLHAGNVFFLGRDLDYGTALEAALKLKEITYLPCEGYPAGELKHGTLALIDSRSVVVAVATQTRLFAKILNAVHEVRARGARVVLISQSRELLESESAEVKLLLPEAPDCIMPILSIIPLQYLACRTALLLGYDPDKPRNLAKSVTVE